jgi:hypothetical protein
MSAVMQPHEAAASDVIPRDVLQRVRAEFLEMPGLRLTRAQARRLWALDETLCDAILAALVEARFLVHSGSMAFMRAE